MRLGYVYSVLATLVFMSCDCLLAGFKALTGDSPVVAVGGTAILHCNTSIPIELKEVWLSRTLDGNNFTINMFKDGRDQPRCDLPQYTGRTEVMRDGLAQGTAAFKLFNVSVADEGTYRCYLGTDTHFAFCDLKLNVTALGSHPRIDIEGFQDGGIKAVCRSVGWYPEPTLVNKDDDGKLKIQKEENGLYSIEYSRVLTENSNRNFSCILRTSFPYQERESSIYVADELFRKDVCIVSSTVSLVLLAAAAGTAFYLWTRQRHKQGTSSTVPTGPLYLKVPMEQGPNNVCTDPV